jgi:antitoxin YefM
VDVINYSDARQNLKDIMDRVVANMTEVVITRQKADPVVMVSLAEWNSINETLHLLSSPKNAERLLSAIHQLESSGGAERELIEAEEPARA